MIIETNVSLKPDVILNPFSYPLYISCSTSYQVQSTSFLKSFIHPLTFVRLRVHWYGYLLSLYRAMRVTPHPSGSPLLNLLIQTATREIDNEIKFTIFLICSKISHWLLFSWRVQCAFFSMHCITELDLPAHPNIPSQDPSKRRHCLIATHVASSARKTSF